MSLKKLSLLFFCVGYLCFFGGVFAAEDELYQLMQYGNNNNISAIKDIVVKNPQTLAKKGEKEPSRYTGLTPIFFIQNTSIYFIKELFSEVPEFKKYLNGVPGEKPYDFTPLLYFVQRGNADGINFLISQGADANALQSTNDYIEATLLHVALSEYYKKIDKAKENKKKKKSPENIFVPVIELLLSKGVSVDQKAKKVKIMSAEKDLEFNDLSSFELAKKLNLIDVINIMEKYSSGLETQEERKQKQQNNVFIDKFASALSTINPK